MQIFFAESAGIIRWSPFFDIDLIYRVMQAYVLLSSRFFVLNGIEFDVDRVDFSHCDTYWVTKVV